MRAERDGRLGRQAQRHERLGRQAERDGSTKSILLVDTDREKFLDFDAVNGPSDYLQCPGVP